LDVQKLVYTRIYNYHYWQQEYNIITSSYYSVCSAVGLSMYLFFLCFLKIRHKAPDNPHTRHKDKSKLQERTYSTNYTHLSIEFCRM